MSPRVKAYCSLTKPRVLYGNVLTGVAGFLLAAGHFGRFDFGLFVATIAGMSLVIGSACALNNVLDQDIDSLMERTKKRAVVSGEVSPFNATVFSGVLGVLGMLILGLWTNSLVAIIGMVGFIVYVWLYGALSKRRSIHGTLVGSISGAMPILAGYVAVSDSIDMGAVLVFLILFFWQFPEFFSIAIYRLEEYKAAKVPVITVVKGVTETKRQIFMYTALFVISTLLLTVFGYTGWIYFIAMAGFGIWWLRIAAKGVRTKPKGDDAWARRMFHASMIMILVLCLALSVGAVLP